MDLEDFDGFIEDFDDSFHQAVGGLITKPQAVMRGLETEIGIPWKMMDNNGYYRVKRENTG